MITHQTPLSNAANFNLEEKIQELSNSVSDVYKYELLTTNQYLKQMEIILDIFDELINVISNEPFLIARARFPPQLPGDNQPR